MNIDYNVNTEINGDDIESNIDILMEGVIQDTWRRIIKTQDEQVRKSLIELGWRPPSQLILPH